MIETKIGHLAKIRQIFFIKLGSTYSLCAHSSCNRNHPGPNCIEQQMFYRASPIIMNISFKTE